MTINDFKKTQDYIDICYMIDHVPLIDTRLDVLKTLGYEVGVDVVKVDNGAKHIIIGKKGEIRMQVTNKYPNVNLANCVIVKNNKK